MHKYTRILFFAAALLISSSAYAGPKFRNWFWWPGHWKNQDFKPYYENGTDQHLTQWDDDKLSNAYWTPREWVTNDGGNGLALIQKWYNGDILRDQRVEDGVPRLVIGPNFYKLGDADKSRVTETIDAVYQVTSRRPKMFYLEDFSTGREIGYYVASGLILQ